jgi:hypothetical protein
MRGGNPPLDFTLIINWRNIMAIARLRTSVADYILECDRELNKDEQTIFKLKGLSVTETAELQDRMLEDKNYATQLLNAIRASLVNWDNLKDADDNLVKFKQVKGSGFNESNFDMLDQTWVMELGNAILKRTFPEMNEGDSKN